MNGLLILDVGNRLGSVARRVGICGSLGVALLAGLVSMSPIATESAHAVPCKFSRSKQFRCNHTGGKWWKGDKKPLKRGAKRVTSEGQSYYWKRRNQNRDGRPRFPGSFPILSWDAYDTTRTTFLDRVATNRLIRQQDQNRISAGLAGGAIFALAVPTSVIWTNGGNSIRTTNLLKTISATLSVGALTIYTITAKHLSFLASEKSRRLYDNILCFYIRSDGWEKHHTLIEGKPRVTQPRVVITGVYANEFTRVCK